MASYLLDLRALVAAGFPVDADRIGITGHSMGGHGALVMALRHPTLFQWVSALAPICAPTRCPWGEKAFGAYLGPRSAAWESYDASALMHGARRLFARGILIDQGLADKFLEEQLYPEVFEAACAAEDQPLVLRRHPAYDHGYYFVASLIGEHLAFHHEALTT